VRLFPSVQGGDVYFEKISAFLIGAFEQTEFVNLLAKFGFKVGGATAFIFLRAPLTSAG
jgi:hypothetical protein